MITALPILRLKHFVLCSLHVGESVQCNGRWHRRC